MTAGTQLVFRYMAPQTSWKTALPDHGKSSILLVCWLSQKVPVLCPILPALIFFRTFCFLSFDLMLSITRVKISCSLKFWIHIWPSISCSQKNWLITQKTGHKFCTECDGLIIGTDLTIRVLQTYLKYRFTYLLINRKNVQPSADILCSCLQCLISDVIMCHRWCCQLLPCSNGEKSDSFMTNCWSFAVTVTKTCKAMTFTCLWG